MIRKNPYAQPFEYKVIYVFKIDDKAHSGKVKIGDATLHTDKNIDELVPNCHELNEASRERIRSYTGTAGIKFDLLHTELAIRKAKDAETGEVELKAFRDHDVHNVLKNSNIPPIRIDNTTGKEWFETSPETAISAIQAVKDGKQNLSGEVIKGFVPIDFRPEQTDAIEMTLKQFKKGNRMLWNAKMRFGKTLSALEVVRRSGEIFEDDKKAKVKRFKKIIIITHRPVVDKGWYEDFGKIFGGGEYGYIYGSKATGYSVKDLLTTGKNFVYFASIQDLRGSEQVGGKFEKNSEIYATNWDLIIIDEAHEGTTTTLGEKVIDQITNDITNEFADSDTKVLSLSGTPFNILTNYQQDEIYTWDYIMEQERKMQWAIEHYGDSNPYDELPQMHIFTYDLGELIKGDYISLDDKAFNFKEFFRVWTDDVDKDGKAMPEGVEKGSFVHAKDVKHFLDLMATSDESSNYPYSTEEYRELFQHSLWMVPGVKEAKALKKMMMEHPVFGSGAFNIVNVAGDGDEEKEYSDALKEVKNAIKKTQPGNYTITLSCGRLTTGVTIREWTAVFMLAGSYSTSASSYLQTIFRVQSPCNKDGRIKEHCYVFDFAPDRTIKMISEGVSRQGGKSGETDKTRLGKFLNFCPVISITGSTMKNYDVTQMLRQLKKAYIERVALNGFDDVKLYNDELLKLDNLEIEKFNDLKRIIGATKAQRQTDEIDINAQGLTEEEYEHIKDLEGKKKKHRELTPEEKAELERRREALRMRDTAISILRGISIRMPLLVYGSRGDFDEHLTLDNFIDNIDDSSWEEFMPNGVTKEKFQEFKKYYNEDMFAGASQKIRDITKSADDLDPTERVKKISELFSHFKNPDKETVLTPWRVVNMHMSDTLGGYDFFDENHKEVIDEPRFVNQGEVTNEVFKKEKVQVLEINSKTGLYPLYVTYSIYREKCKQISKDALTLEKKKEIWNDVVKNDIFIICKTPMAKSITKRTLLGYNEQSINTHYMEDFVGQFQNKSKQLTEKLLRPSYWNKNGTKMNFDAVVGNPPYQLQVNEPGKGLGAVPLYQEFVNQAIDLNPLYVSMITPSRWFSGGVGLDKFRESMLSSKKIRKMTDFIDSKELFPGVDINGGICYFLWDSNHDGDCNFTNILNGIEDTSDRKLDEFRIFIRRNDAVSIIKKVQKFGEKTFTQCGYVSPQTPYGFLSTFRGRDKRVFETDCEILGSKGWMFVERSKVEKGKDSIDLYKTMISKLSCEHAGSPDRNGMYRVLSRMEILKPGQICTQSYLVIKPTRTERETENVFKYLRTKLARFLILQTLSGMNISIDNFAFLPEQDFTDGSKINWSNSVASINEQLYKKYDLSQNEINCIESTIKQMDNEE